MEQIKIKMISENEKRVLLTDLGEIVEKINQEVEIVIVEGRKDMQALLRLGVTIELVFASKLNVSALTDRKVLILTDFDAEGAKISQRIHEKLTGKAQINDVLRKDFGKILTNYGRRDIESINNLLVS